MIGFLSGENHTNKLKQFFLKHLYSSFFVIFIFLEHP